MKIIKNTLIVTSMLTIALAVSTSVQAIDWGAAKIEKMFGEKPDWRALASKMQQYAKSRDYETMQQMLEQIKASAKLTDAEKEKLKSLYTKLVKYGTQNMAQEEAYRKEKEEYKERKMKGMLED